MAAHTRIDILGAFNNIGRAILGAKVDLQGLSINSPFAGTLQSIEANEKRIKKMKDDLKKQAELDQLKAVKIQQKASGGAGTNIQAPARIRNRI